MVKDLIGSSSITEMTRSSETSPSLLIRIRDSEDVTAWNRFVDIYAPLIHDYGRRRGLQDADAADLAQEVLQAVAKSADRFDYDTRKGSFRGWLFTITRNKLINLVERLRRQRLGSGDCSVAIDQLATIPDNDALWEQQHQWWLVHWAADQVKDEFESKTWRAFMMTSIDQVSPAEVGSRLEMSVGSVYIAKSRLLARLKQVIQEVEGEA